MNEALQMRWNALCARLGCDTQSASIFDQLVRAYDHPYRAYHNLDHIRQCLDQFELLRHQATDPGALEMAIWFHDAVYDSKLKDNEERSAAMFRNSFGNAGFSPDFLQKVESLIMATKHVGTPSDLDSKIMVDTDLSILGMQPEMFDRYEAQIRQEYEWVPRPDYVAGRSAVLRHFLERPHIFQTEDFWARYEEQARANLIRSIQRL